MPETRGFEGKIMSAHKRDIQKQFLNIQSAKLSTTFQLLKDGTKFRS